MTQELAVDLANNAKEWRALSQLVSSAERVSFGNIHGRFLARYGPNFMAHVYRSAIEGVLPSLPDAARRQALDGAIDWQAYALPTAADCSACHARKL